VVGDGPATEDEFAAAAAEPRAAGYLPLLEVCRLILNGLTCAVPLGTGSGAFLVDLGRAFERYLTRALHERLARRPGWTVESHPPFAIGPTELQPDILVRKEGVPWAVLDAKWKAARPEASDLHQVLAYGAVSGVDRVALVYPGRKDDRAHFATPDGRVRVSLYRLRVVGTADQLTRSIAKLSRRVRKD
jgi:5-methylcytosine-specific restriction enzyme subunit McrC